MADESTILAETAKFTGGGVGLAGGLYMVRWIIQWFTGRFDKRQAEIDGDASELDQKWRAYRKTIEDRCFALEGKVAHLEGEIDKCHAEKREILTLLTKYIANADARGEMRQSKQISESLTAIIDRDKGSEI